jgi:hypothetical protein
MYHAFSPPFLLQKRAAFKRQDPPQTGASGLPASFDYATDLPESQ